MKPEKRRDGRLKKFWRSPRPVHSSEDSGGCESPTSRLSPPPPPSLPPLLLPSAPHATCALPLLQVWPSQDSPRGEADGQSFVFPVISDEQQGKKIHVNDGSRRNSLFGNGSGCGDPLHVTAGDSGIDSIQASPSPNALPPHCLLDASTVGGLAAGLSGSISAVTLTGSGGGGGGGISPLLSSFGGGRPRRLSSALLHPDHAILFAMRRQSTSPDQTSVEDMTEFNGSGSGSGCGGGGGGVQMCTASSSTTSSLTSVAAVSLGPSPQRSSDPWLQGQQRDRRRSSTMTARYSLFDALDLEYALLRAAARGSVGPYSLSESLHKLTFTQSLAFPALARGLATKRRHSATHSSTRPLDPHESGVNTFVKIVTAVVLVAVSFLVFLIVYKFVRT